MLWIVFVAGAVLSWGAYGAMLHMGQTQLGNPLKALLCVGVAYFLIGILVPVAALGRQGQLNNFDSKGLMIATIAQLRRDRRRLYYLGVPQWRYPVTSCRSCLVERLSSMFF
jgi:hypothetical protein